MREYSSNCVMRPRQFRIVNAWIIIRSVAVIVFFKKGTDKLLP